jgi:hypothetical protein
VHRKVIPITTRISIKPRIRKADIKFLLRKLRGTP